jgi:hypothetical protein
MHFYVETQKTLVTKICWPCKDANMQISTKNGTMVPEFAMELAQTMVTWLEVQENSYLEATLCEEFSYEPLAWLVWYFS